MRNVLIIFACICMVACKKTATPTTPSTPTPTTTKWAKFIPHWWNNDTLYATVLDSLNQPIGQDTIITKNVNDTSFIIYRNKQYYIWTESISGLDTFENDRMQYGNIKISLDRNTNNTITNSILNTAIPHKYKDQQGNWSYQRQMIGINDYKNFKKTNLGAYSSMRQYK